MNEMKALQSALSEPVMRLIGCFMELKDFVRSFAVMQLTIVEHRFGEKAWESVGEMIRLHVGRHEVIGFCHQIGQ